MFRNCIIFLYKFRYNSEITGVTRNYGYYVSFEFGIVTDVFSGFGGDDMKRKKLYKTKIDKEIIEDVRFH